MNFSTKYPHLPQQPARVEKDSVRKLTQYAVEQAIAEIQSKLLREGLIQAIKEDVSLKWPTLLFNAPTLAPIYGAVQLSASSERPQFMHVASSSDTSASSSEELAMRQIIEKGNLLEQTEERQRLERMTKHREALRMIFGMWKDREGGPPDGVEYQEETRAAW